MLNIYCYENILTNDVYIGQANKSLYERSGGDSFCGYKKCIKFYNAIQKYGSENFVGWIFEVVDTQEQADQSEIFWIAEMRRLLGRDRVYNIMDGGNGGQFEVPVAIETRAKISKSTKNRKTGRTLIFNNDTKKILSIKSKNNKGKLSIAQKREVINLFDSGLYTKKQLANKLSTTYETIRFIINYYKKNGFKTEEEKFLNRSNARKGKKLTNETKYKISESGKNRIFTDETKQKISKALTGKIISQDTRNKIATTLSSDPNYIENNNKILELFLTGSYKQIELAKLFNVNYARVKKIIKRYRKQQNA